VSSRPSAVAIEAAVHAVLPVALPLFEDTGPPLPFTEAAVLVSAVAVPIECADLKNQGAPIFNEILDANRILNLNRLEGVQLSVRGI
jgi:hypothetical protein